MRLRMEGLRLMQCVKDSANLCWLSRWKVEAMCQGMWAASRSWKRSGNGFSPRVCTKEHSLANPLSSVGPVWDF